MIPRCPRCTLLGFAASALLHLGIACAIIWQDEPKKVSLNGERQVAVTLAMFAGPEGSSRRAEDRTRTSEPAPEREPESKTETETVPAAESPALAPEPEFEPIPKADPLPEQEPKPEPRIKSKSASKPRPKSAPKPKPKPKSKPAPKPKPKTESKASLKPNPGIRPTSRPSANRGTDGSKGGSSSRSPPSARGGDKKNGARTKALEQEYLAGLRRAIAKKRRYPGSARRRGDTGVATVSFVIAQNGRISDARVDKSSGSSALDKAAVETLRRLGRYKPIPDALGRSRWSLRVPIRFAFE